MSTEWVAKKKLACQMNKSKARRNKRIPIESIAKYVSMTLETANDKNKY